MKQYNIYPSLLDAYQWYLDSEADIKEDERLNLIDKINRVPLADTEAADRGTCFNELVDAVNENRRPKGIEVVSKTIDEKDGRLYVHCKLNGHAFRYDAETLKSFARQYEGSIAQRFCQGTMDTACGSVRLYGYIDKLMPFSVHDIKTTGSYAYGKYKNHWQHIVYPYCLRQEDYDLKDFEYNIIELGSNGTTKGVYTEYYRYDVERDEARLRYFLEDFIGFIEDNRDRITDKKIFNRL